MGISIQGLDTAFGSLRTAVTNEVKNIIGGLHVDANIGNGQPAGVTVSLGERRVLSAWALGLALAVGAIIAYAIARRTS